MFLFKDVKGDENVIPEPLHGQTVIRFLRESADVLIREFKKRPGTISLSKAGIEKRSGTILCPKPSLKKKLSGRRACLR